MERAGELLAVAAADRCLGGAVIVALGVLTFAWPAARIGPRDLPVGVVGAGPAAAQAVKGLTGSEPRTPTSYD